MRMLKTLDGRAAVSNPGRTIPILSIGFTAITLLIAISGVVLTSRGVQLYASLDALNEHHRTVEHTLAEIRSGVQISAVLTRDLLSDTTKPERLASYRSRLLQYRSDIDGKLLLLRQSLEPENRARWGLLRTEVDAYWQSIDPILSWSAKHDAAANRRFLLEKVIPHREAILSLADEIALLSSADRLNKRERINAGIRQYRSFSTALTAALVAIAVLVAAAIVRSVSRLVRSLHTQQLRAEKAEAELRRLSAQLVHAHEEERRALSRELHDEVGQMLTGLRMELASLQNINPALGGPEWKAKVEDARALLDETVVAVRDLAMGLRPSMLDDLGLLPALEWQAREFSRRYDVPVNIQVKSGLDHLTDTQKTAIYRIVQEALTNCARHAEARAVVLDIGQTDTSLLLRIRDDGVGMTKDTSERGLGLVGIQERVRQLNGTFSIVSDPGQGTELTIILPAIYQEAPVASLHR